MRRARAATVWLLGLALTCAPNSRGQEPAKPGRARLEDELLQKLVGDWAVSRRIRGTVVTNSLHADWVLLHQFVELHMKDTAEPPQYEARVLVGYDAAAQRYVAHWCDSFGAQASSVGYGKRSGNTIDFAFAYPEGPFHNRFTWDPSAGTWRFLMEAEGKDGARRFFAEDTARKR